MKADYLAVIQEAGFEEGDILTENSFPLQCMANDATTQAIIENVNCHPRSYKRLKIPL
jgi:hypothetical protein